MTATVAALPAVNACLNAASLLLLAAGWLFIRNRKVDAHRACMAAAFACSAVFLASYLYYHARVGHVRFGGTGALRAVYLAILASHTILAAVIVPMILRTLFLAVRERFEEHRWWARRTLPAWLYVCVTGVVIYLMLYRL